MNDTQNDQLINELDNQQQKAFYRIAEKSLKKEFTALMSSIQNKQWQDAVEKNHLLKSTAILTKCEPLLQTIEQAEDENDLLKQENFVKHLNENYENCLRKIINEKKAL